MYRSSIKGWETRGRCWNVPEDRLTWKPHEKSMSLGRLAQHVAELPRLAVVALQTDFRDMAGWKPPEPLASREELLNLFDSKRSEARDAIASASDESLMRTWSVKVGKKTIFSMPRAAVVRSFVLTQIVHHRGQLSVYLRLNDIPVPGMYGPSADESN
ncbi:MAG TPA: DinB family protein [Bryobacteraceae bacterium]|nr:DinB family protein [Bryobacteraceae bacterium]